jgi:hypothetical protein
MKKFFIVLSALAALMLCVVPAQALVGSPDDVPGMDAVVPFICDRTLTSGLNTLIVFEDVQGGFNPAGTRTTYAAVYHYTVNTVESVTVHDANLTGSPRAVISTDAFTILTAASVAAKTALEVTIDGGSYYAGYIYFKNLAADTTSTNYNSVLGQFFFVNLAAGKAAACNIPMKEYALTTAALANGSAEIVNASFLNEMVANPGGDRTDADVNDANAELFSAQAMMAGMDLQAGRIVNPTAPTNFYIFPRVFVADATAANWWIFWSSANDLPTATTIHVNIYNENETAISSNIPLDSELEIVDTKTYLPSGLWTAYPYSGFVDLNWATSTAALQAQEFLGWSYLQATGTASESWTVLFPMGRDVD